MLILHATGIAYQDIVAGPNGESMTALSWVECLTDQGVFVPIERNGYDELTFSSGLEPDIRAITDGLRGVHISGTGIVTVYGFLNGKRHHRRVTLGEGYLEVLDQRTESAVTMAYAIKKSGGDVRKGIEAYSKVFLCRSEWRHVNVETALAHLKKFKRTSLLGIPRIKE